MVSASVSDLKARLSHYLRIVRRGGEVQVLDRGVPVARLVAPVGAEEDSRQRLIQAGVIRPAVEPSSDILAWEPIDADLLGALLEDRDDRI